MTRRRMYAILALILCSIAVGVWLYARRGTADPVIRETATVTKGEVRKTLEATGIIKPQVGAVVKTGSRFTGIIRKLHVKVGDRVEKDEVIAEIDDREQRAQLDEAEAKLRQAEAEAARVETSYPLQIREAEAQVQAARAESEYAALTMERKRKLVEQDLDARNSLDEAQQRSRSLSNVLVAREATLDRLRNEFRTERKRTRQAAEQAKAALETARIRLSYAVIRSPISGIVSQVTAPEGETVVAGFQVVNLITILDPSRLEMWIYVDETDVGQVRPGLDVEFRVDSQPEKTFRGVVDQIYPQPEIRDNIVYYQALVRLDPATSEHLRPEMTTQCRIIVASKKDVLVIPNDAIKWVDGGRVVFIDDGGKVRRVKPVLGTAGPDVTEVVEGLAEGQKVGVRVELPGASKGARK